MGKSIFWKSLSYSLVFLIVSCVTINIYFPAAAVEKAADRIVDEVWGNDGETPEKEKQQEQDGETQSLFQRSIMLVFSAIGPREAHAQEADINVTTPAIRTLKKSIKERAESIKPFMDKGNAGISNQGLLVQRNNDGLNLKDKARLKRLLAAENKDRNALYSEIAKANNYSPDRVKDIKRIFTASWIKNAKASWWVQDPAGNWKKK